MNKDNKLIELEQRQRDLADEIKALREQPEELEIDWSKMIGVSVVCADTQRYLADSTNQRQLIKVSSGSEFPINGTWKLARLPDTQHIGLKPFKGDKMPDELNGDDDIIAWTDDCMCYVMSTPQSFDWEYVTHYAKIEIHKG